MNLEKTGGPAFPNPQASFDHSGAHDAYMGMDLRDYLAAKAMEGDWAAGNGGLAGETMDEAAQRYYAMADAMLRARRA